MYYVRFQIINSKPTSKESLGIQEYRQNKGKYYKFYMFTIQKSVYIS